MAFSAFWNEEAWRKGRIMFPSPWDEQRRTEPAACADLGRRLLGEILSAEQPGGSCEQERRPDGPSLQGGRHPLRAPSVVTTSGDTILRQPRNRATVRPNVVLHLELVIRLPRYYESFQKGVHDAESPIQGVRSDAKVQAATGPAGDEAVLGPSLLEQTSGRGHQFMGLLEFHRYDDPRLDALLPLHPLRRLGIRRTFAPPTAVATIGDVGGVDPPG